MSKDSVGRTISVAAGLCIVCSILVSSAAVVLKSAQDANKTKDRQQNILSVSGLNTQGMTIAEAFENIDTRLVDLETGEYVTDIDPATYDQTKAAKDSKDGIAINSENDVAGIKRRAKIAFVYLVRNGEELSRVILPVHGKGLWSTMYGFLALGKDLETIEGFSFYQHGETPGLGGEVDNPNWKASWKGKKAFDEQGDLEIEVIKGAVDPSREDAKYHIDGLAGATMTSRGVTNLLHYWLGENGFGPYLSRLKTELGGKKREPSGKRRRR